MAQHSKQFKALTAKIKTTGPVAVPEAVRMLKVFNTAKFNRTVEVSTHLGIDPKQTDQNVRGSVALPHGIGKSVRVAVLQGGAEKPVRRGRYRGGRRPGPANQGWDHGLRRGPGHA